MRPLLLYTTLLFTTVLPCTAQNLVPNPSFEIYNKCPNNISGLEYSPGYVTFPTVQWWVNPIQLGSADYFNACTPQMQSVSVPANAFGYQPARTGKAYLGIIAWEGRIQGGSMANTFAEYVQCKLTRPMVAGNSYCVTYYVSNAVSNATYNFVGIDAMSVNFSTSKATQPTGYTLSLPVSAGNKQGKYLTDTSQWMRVSAVYTAAGGEEWMTMGWFDNGGTPAFQPVKPAAPNTRDNYRCYLYIDDVSVVRLSNTDTFFSVMDSTFCKPGGFSVDLSSRSSIADHKWNNGAGDATINVHDTGTYWCLASAGCITYIDTFKIHYKPAPELDLGKEQVNCKSQPVTIHANYPNSTYAWSTGATGESIQVDSSGIYYLTISNDCGSQTDSVHVYIQPPTPTPPPTDTVICQFTSDVSINVPGEHINWYTSQDGKTGLDLQPPIVTREPGSYKLFITQTVGKCESKKAPVSIGITYTPHEELGDKVVMCDNDIQEIGSSQPGVDYKWNTGSTSCCVLPAVDGLYKRAAENSCGSFIDSLWVIFTTCEDCIVFPNAFTPVNGSANNIFRPIIKCPVDEFNIKIFNRWGNMVYESNDVHQGWNGRFNADWATQDVYVYIVQYRAHKKKQMQVIKGDVTLLR